MITEGCLRVGQEAPEFTATAVYDQEFKTVKLADYRGQYVVLFKRIAKMEESVTLTIL